LRLCAARVPLIIRAPMMPSSIGKVRTIHHLLSLPSLCAHLYTIHLIPSFSV
jgi:hypothetical protein